MSAETTIYAALSNDAGVSAIVSTHISPLVRKQADPLPCVTYLRISGVPITSIDGDNSNLDSVRIQIDSWAASYAGAKALDAAVRAAMKTTGALPVMDMDAYEDDEATYRVTRDYVLVAQP